MLGQIKATGKSRERQMEANTAFSGFRRALQTSLPQHLPPPVSRLQTKREVQGKHLLLLAHLSVFPEEALTAGEGTAHISLGRIKRG